MVMPLKVRTAVMPLLHGNAFMPEQISLGKQVSLFKRCFCDHTFSFFLNNKIENVFGEKCICTESRICSVAQLTARPPTQT